MAYSSMHGSGKPGERKRVAPRLDIEKRLVTGVVSSVDLAGLIHLHLPQSFPYAQNARVRMDKLPKGKVIHDFHEGDFLRLFMIRPHADNPVLWHADARWPDDINNPWLTQWPENGEEVTGTVDRYVEDFIALISLDKGLEAGLHRNHLPGSPSGDIAQHLHVGDRINAVVVETDKAVLNIALSVNHLLTRRKEEELNRRLVTKPNTPRTHLALPNIQQESPISSDISLTGVYLLIIDDDREFARSLKWWITMVQGESYYTHDLTEAKRHQKRVTHILLDCSLGDVDLDHAFRQWASAANKPVAMISGQWNLTRSIAEPRGWTSFPKPIQPNQLQAWLRTGEAPSSPELGSQGLTQVNHLWRVGLEEERVYQQGSRFLQHLCQKTNCLAALWIRQERPGIFYVPSSYMVEQKNIDLLEPLMARTPVPNAIETRQAYEGNQWGELKLVAPPLANTIWVMPLEVEEQCQRALVFFNQGPFSYHVKEYIEAQKDRMNDLVEWLALIRHIQESEPFAAIGLVSSGLIHDIRGSAGPLALLAEELRQGIKNGLSPNLVKEQLKDIAQTASRIAEMARSDLTFIQRQRADLVNVNSVIQRIIRLMRQKIPEGVAIRLEADLPEKELIIALSPQVLERPLINLLDNAIHHMYRREWGRIQVIVRYHIEDKSTPLYISVEDNGYGINATQKQMLFDPRQSTKGPEGIGMGLYVSRNLVRMAGGDLELTESFRWFGSKFLLKFQVYFGTKETTPIQP
ncbi:MAG: ATP-binding protein [Magnetococcus sp. YQC-5]